MNAVLHRLHALWCAVTGRCPVDLTQEKRRLKDDDPYVSWMVDQEQASIDALQRRQKRRQNFMEAEMTRRQREGARRDC